MHFGETPIMGEIAAALLGLAGAALALRFDDVDRLFHIFERQDRDPCQRAGDLPVLGKFGVERPEQGQYLAVELADRIFIAALVLLLLEHRLVGRDVLGALDLDEHLEHPLREAAEGHDELGMDAKRQLAGIGRRGGADLRLAADRDQHVAHQGEVKHLLLKDVAQGIGQRVALVLDRPERGQIGRNGREFEQDGAVQCGDDRLALLRLVGRGGGLLGGAELGDQLRELGMLGIAVGHANISCRACCVALPIRWSLSRRVIAVSVSVGLTAAQVGKAAFEQT